MKKRTTYLFSLIFLMAFVPLSAQKIGIGEWRDHLSYHQSKGVAAVGNEIYVISNYGLFVYNQEDGMIDRMSKINGLSDIGFNRIAYYPQKKSLCILYDNCNIDIIKNGAIYTLPDVKSYSLEEKTFNNIYFDNQLAYICSNFGIVVINIENMEIKDTYKMGVGGNLVRVFDVTSDDSCFYAATENGIYKANKNNYFLSYYDSWTRINVPENENSYYKYIEFYGDSLVYVLSGARDTVYKQSVLGSTPIKMYEGICYDLNVTENQLTLTYDNGFYIYKNNMLSNPIEVSKCQAATIKPRQVVVSNDVYWIADNKLGLLKAKDLSDIQKIGKPNGPFSHNVFNMTAYKDYVWTVTGYYIDNSWMYGEQKEGAFSFDGTTWRSFNSQEENVPQHTHDITIAAVNPSNPSQAFLGTWGCGLYQFDNQELTTIYDESNSTLQPRSAAVEQGIFVSGIAFDSKNNMWVANSSCNNLLSCRYANGSWKSFDMIITANEDIRTLTIDQYDQKWIITRYREILVFKESDDGNHVTRRIAVPKSEGGAKEDVFSLAFDKKGTLWIGTNNGIVLLDNPEEVLEKSGSSFKSLHFTYPKIEWGGYTRPLLSGETITDILINENNDKWISTEYSGLYKLSEYGTEQLEHFTADNSPLFSDNVVALSQTSNGELFIGTSCGILSYRDIASESKEDNSEVYVFPNPVKAGYNGYIAITNLVNKSYIKITDISGTLVYDCQASGGQALWDGKNLKGQRVKTGVYLVFIANEDGSQKEVTKIMFLN